MIQDWISGNSGAAYGPTSTPALDAEEAVMALGFPNGKEVALIHPGNSSIVKIKDNGMIDIFTATNQGIRIDPTKHTVNIFGEDEVHHLQNLKIWANKIISMNAKLDINVITKSSMRQDIKKDWTVTVGGDASIAVSGNVTVNAAGNVNVTGHSVSVKSDSELLLQAKHITFDADRYDYE